MARESAAAAAAAAPAIVKHRVAWREVVIMIWEGEKLSGCHHGGWQGFIKNSFKKGTVM